MNNNKEILVSIEDEQPIFHTNNRENIILVHYISVMGLSPSQADQKINRYFRHADSRNERIKEIYIPLETADDSQTRVECIYPVAPSKDILDKLAELEEKMNNYINQNNVL